MTRKLCPPKGTEFDVVMRFPTKKCAQDFLSYMSDGGGEQYYGAPQFNYWKLNRGEFGPHILVIGEHTEDV